MLNFEYAAQIAKDWNTKDPASDYAGFVTRFAVEQDYVERFPVQVVGSSEAHQELWIPAEDLEEFNRHIVGKIEVAAAYYGEGFDGEIDPVVNLPASIVVKGTLKPLLEKVTEENIYLEVDIGKAVGKEEIEER